jgi:hypothetical protein
MVDVVTPVVVVVRVCANAESAWLCMTALYIGIMATKAAARSVVFKSMFSSAWVDLDESTIRSHGLFRR